MHPSSAMSTAAMEGVRVDDLIDGLNEWRNIQDVVRLTFKALHDVVKAQGDAIRNLERTVETKCGSAEVHTLVGAKANVLDVNRSLAEIGKALDTKADASEVAFELGKKYDTSEAQVALGQKASTMDVKEMVELRSSTVEMNKTFERYERHMSSMFEDVDRNFQRIKADLQRKAGASEMTEELEKKSNVHDVQSWLATKSNASDVDEALQQKASKQSVVTQLQRKANKHEVDSVLDTKAAVTEVAKQLSKKADVDAVNHSLMQKASLDHVAERVEKARSELQHSLMKEITARPSKAELEMKANLSAVQGWLANTVERKELSDTIAALVKKVDHDSRHQLNDLEGALVARVDTKLATNDFVESYDKLCNRDAEVKGLLTELDTDYRLYKQDMDAVLATLATKSDMGVLATSKAEKHDVNASMALKSNIDDVNRVLERKADLTDVNEALSHKPSITDVNTALDQKMNIEDANDALALKSSIHDVNLALDLKANRTELHETNEALARLRTSAGEIAAELGTKSGQQSLEELRKEVSTKSNIKDVCALLDVKPNIEDVNKALVEVNKELDSKASLTELARTIQDQTAINESMCAELTVGRWIWKTGETKAGHKVPWNVQTVNTNTNNFVWEKDKCNIICNAPGLYEITFGFFARKKPTVQLYVNGEVVMSAINSASYVVHHSSGRLSAVDHHSSGNVTGLTLIDFLALPPRGRVSLSYSGVDGAEAFLGLRKL